MSALRSEQVTVALLRRDPWPVRAQLAVLRAGTALGHAGRPVAAMAYVAAATMAIWAAAAMAYATMAIAAVALWPLALTLWAAIALRRWRRAVALRDALRHREVVEALEDASELAA